VFRQLTDKGFSYDAENGQRSLARLSEPHEQTLMVELSRLPEMIEIAARNLEPHLLAQYLREVATAFHTWYDSHQFLVDDKDLRDARLTLSRAARQVLRNGLALLGVSAPESM
jgi:arginyl-tRNA synthetase